jgi:hypothetical protein
MNETLSLFLVECKGVWGDQNYKCMSVYKMIRSFPFPFFFFPFYFRYKMSNMKDESKPQIEQVEHIPSGQEQEKTSHESKKKNWLIRFKDSIYTKPESTPNVWHLLVNLNNTQRITFVAGGLTYFPSSFYSLFS